MSENLDAHKVVNLNMHVLISEFHLAAALKTALATIEA